MLSSIVGAQVGSEPTAVIRVLLGTAALWIATVSRPAFHELTYPEVLNVPTFAFSPTPTAALVQLTVAVWICAAAVLITGIFARAAALTVAGAGTLMAATDLQMISNHLTLMIALCLLIALGRPGAALSARPSQHTAFVAYWPVFLLKVQLSTLYLFTSVSKINAAWLSGLAFRNSVPHLVLLPDRMVGPVTVMLAVTSVVIELSLAFALWLPRVRAAAAMVGFVFHVGIIVAMPPPALAPFGLMALALYPLFFQQPRTAEVPRSGGVGGEGAHVRGRDVSQDAASSAPGGTG
jgi:hypothetical protein